ncbi:hypothetical protein [Listeria seeligeri]|uniref:hypothetical protein n=1 Tax=Listeria seeligeri TaxID=1640 RepID=UPI001628D43E|nr:hypothetical protein [Listeria seeligeri]MBC1824242.1 hypothetical protein [Listeria seeligeri]MBC1837824.1 hypothetical protein [Listeria seeligeri]
MKKFNRYEFAEQAILMFLAALAVITGLVMLNTPDFVLLNSHTYEYLSLLIPIESWAWLFILNGLLYVTAMLINDELKVKFALFLIAGVVGAIIWFLFATAGFEALRASTSYARSYVIGVFNLLTAFVGGVELWRSSVKSM